MSEPETPAPTPPRARTWLIVGVGALLVAAGGLYLLFSTMPADPIADAPAPAGPPADETAEPDMLTEGESFPAIAVTYDILLTRDPFDPIRPEQPTPPPPSDDPNSEPTGPTDPPADGDPEDPAPTTPTTPTTPADLPVVVFDVSSDGAVVQVGDVIYDATVGDTFATRYRLEAVVSGCARIRDVTTGGEQVICPTTQTFK